MRIEYERERLTQAVQEAAKFAPTKTAHPILTTQEAAKFAPTKTAHPILTTLRLTPDAIEACDLEAHYRRTLRGTGDGDVSVDARELLAFLKEAEGPTIVVTREGSAAALVSARGASMTLTTRESSDRPIAPSTPPHDAATCSRHVASDLFADVFTRALKSASTDTARPHMTGVALLHEPIRTRGHSYDVATTDGHRLFLGRLSMSPLPATVLVSREVAEAVARIYRRANGLLEVGTYLVGTQRRYFIRDAERTIDAHQIDAQFPPVARVVPSDDVVNEPDAIVELPIKAGRAACKRLLAKGGRRVIGAMLSIRQHEVGESLVLDNAEGSKETIAIPYRQGLVADQLVAVNAAYLADALAESGDHVVVEIRGDLDPIVFKSDRALQVVMPFRADAPSRTHGSHRAKQAGGAR